MAAALLLIAAIAGGAWWPRRSPDPVPVTPPPLGSLTGLWTFTNPLTSNLIVVRPDGKVWEYDDAMTLVRHLVGEPDQVIDDRQRIRLQFTDGQGRPCHIEWPVLERRDGFVAQGVQTLTGPGCSVATQPESTITRLSPMSDAAG